MPGFCEAKKAGAGALNHAPPLADIMAFPPVDATECESFPGGKTIPTDISTAG